MVKIAGCTDCIGWINCRHSACPGKLVRAASESEFLPVIDRDIGSENDRGNDRGNDGGNDGSRAKNRRTAVGPAGGRASTR